METLHWKIDPSIVKDQVYIAGPFFDTPQLEFVKEIEARLMAAGIKFFSPRSTGVLIEMTPEEKKTSLAEIYGQNVWNMLTSSVMVAIIDDRDAGTIFEMGYFTALAHANKIPRRLISITQKDHGMNVMLRQSVCAHLRGANNLIDCVLEALGSGPFYSDRWMDERGETW